jgi:hypothetical protein
MMVRGLNIGKHVLSAWGRGIGRWLVVGKYEKGNN